MTVNIGDRPIYLTVPWLWISNSAIVDESRRFVEHIIEKRRFLGDTRIFHIRTSREAAVVQWHRRVQLISKVSATPQTRSNPNIEWISQINDIKLYFTDRSFGGIIRICIWIVRLLHLELSSHMWLFCSFIYIKLTKNRWVSRWLTLI